jgi:hypothetical protein
MAGAEHPRKRGCPKKEKGRGKRTLSGHGWNQRHQKNKGTEGSAKTPSPTCDTVAQAVKKRRAASKQLGQC